MFLSIVKGNDRIDEDYKKKCINCDFSEVKSNSEPSSSSVSPLANIKPNESEVKFDSDSQTSSSDTKVSTNDKIPALKR